MLLPPKTGNCNLYRSTCFKFMGRGSSKKYINHTGAMQVFVETIQNRDRVQSHASNICAASRNSLNIIKKFVPVVMNLLRKLAEAGQGNHQAPQAPEPSPPLNT
ncbi:uncharacterized protein A4U43_C03F5370 [Asparagus officinalis]|uniref:Uncharacterized protein n=1 Tax=Asparagus officinalis TaxID=4686 RepID=A0A5P1F894_ASPOF|nr:uncharacterized protein A4U43_C03F5370 [Asparagus officinalis]